MILIALRRAAVVPEQGDVQFPAFHRTVFDLSDAVSDPTGQYGAAAADADQTQILRTPVALYDLKGDPGNCPADGLGVHNYGFFRHNCGFLPSGCKKKKPYPHGR